MRLACIWPLFIGLKTLALLARSPNLLDPKIVIKIPRGAVYRMMARSLMLIGSDAALDRYYRRLWRSVAVSE
jgi:farnesyl-diphosphate farnesyltransferase